MSATTLWTRLRHALGAYPTNARDWTVRVMSSDVSRRELLALCEWLKADPRNAEAFARMNKVSHVGLMFRDHPEERSRVRAYAKLNVSEAVTRGSQPQWRWALAGGAALASFLGTAVFFLVPLFVNSPTEYVSGRGEQRQVALADGSRMIVNAVSRVSVHFNDRERAISLDHGEAFFDVAKEVSRPFIVRTRGAEVRAVGTKFSVRRINGETEVVVTHGIVQVVRGGSAGATAKHAVPVQVVPGHVARVAPTPETIQVAAIDPEQATAWTSGIVVFQEVTLAEAIRDLNRYAMKQFIIDDPALRGIRFSGRFHVGDVESVKFALSNRFQVIAVEDGSNIRLSRER